MRTILVVLGIAASASAQSSVRAPRFDVASIKLSPQPTDESVMGRVQPGDVRFSNLALMSGILPLAFQVPPPQAGQRFDTRRVSRDIISRTKFDIHAKGPVDGDNAAMALTLLVERFGLKWHRETRQVPRYVLTSTGKLGPWLKPSTVNCSELSKAGAALPQECRGSRGLRNGTIPYRNAGSLSLLILRIQNFATLPIVDETGLKGNYAWDVALGYGLDQAGLQDAIKDQLGLKVETRTGPWEVIVIDDVRMPTPN